MLGRKEALQFPKCVSMVGVRSDADVLNPEKSGRKLECRVVGKGKTSIGIKAFDLRLSKIPLYQAQEICNLFPRGGLMMELVILQQ